MPRDDAGISSVTPAEAVAEPKLVVAVGRGRVGKSTVLRALVDRAENAGREVAVADGDTRNPTLSKRYPTAFRPPSGEAEDVKAWLAETLNGAAEGRYSVCLDLGGGDRFLQEFGRDIDLVGFCREVGLAPVALHVMGPDLDDLRHCARIHEVGNFRPERTVLVLNEGLGRTTNPLREFAPLLAMEEFRAFEERGARVVYVPKLPCMAQVPDEASFYAASAWATSRPLGLVQRFQVKQWLQALEAEDGFGKVASWLP